MTHTYLKHYAAPECKAIPKAPLSRARAIVVPVYDEKPGFLDRLAPALDDTLLIAVVNVPDDAPAPAVQRTQELLRNLRRRGGGHGQSVELVRRARYDLLLIERVSQPIPRREGVGGARKIGADIAATLIRRVDIENPWIYVTDADVSLPESYPPRLPGQAGTAVFAFRHEPDSGLEERARTYDWHLHYYVERLGWAGSRYAFHTLGGALAVRVDSYCKVRGFPRRNAAEDFYLLNKLAKVDPVYLSHTPELSIRARASHRVPFGTGPRIADMQRPFLSYASESFELLQDAIGWIDALAHEREVRPQAETVELMKALGFSSLLAKTRSQYRAGRPRWRALHGWFDAFRTLRFIHEARRYHPDCPIEPTLQGLYGAGDHRTRMIEAQRTRGPWRGLPTGA